MDKLIRFICFLPKPNPHNLAGWWWRYSVKKMGQDPDAAKRRI